MDSETKYIFNWYFTVSRETTSALLYFLIMKLLLFYSIPIKVVFDSSKHIKVQSWFGETMNNLVESLF